MAPAMMGAAVPSAHRNRQFDFGDIIVSPLQKRKRPKLPS